MKPNPYPGLFIDIEGLDGSGASTQVELVRQRLLRDGFSAYTTKEPTDNVIGGLIRGALTGVYKLPPDSLQLLFVADRRHHLEREIIPVLNNGNILITDRFLWSTIAFGAIKLSRRWLLQIHHYCFLPDLSIFLRVSPKTCIKRIKDDRFDFELFEEEDKLWRVWEGYEWLAKKFPKEIKIIDGELNSREITNEIIRLVERHPKYKNLKKADTDKRSKAL